MLTYQVRFFPNFNLREFQLLVLHCGSNKFEVSTAYRFLVNVMHRTDGWTGYNTYRPDTRALAAEASRYVQTAACNELYAILGLS